ncbi:MAG: BofC C-terminal domain-containing protein [Ectobacillus sp.]
MKFMMIVQITAAALYFVLGGVCDSSISAAQAQQLASNKEHFITVILQRAYLDGEVSEEIFAENVSSLEQMLQRYRDWQLVDRDDMQIVLQKRINDISPLLKTSGYFGVSKDGILQIFKGAPKADNVIHSFFQIDVKKLESYQRERLERGVRIKSRERYVKMLNEMKSYSIKKD